MPPTASTLRTSSTLQRQLQQQFGHIKNSAKKLATSCASPTSRYKTTPSNTQVGSLRSAENGSLFSLGHSIHLERLCQHEYVVSHGRQGGLYRYSLLYDGKGREGQPSLLGLVDATSLAEPAIAPTTGDLSD